MRLYAGVALSFLAARGVQLWIAGMGVGGDVWGYLSYAQAWGGGGAPYADFHPEYPPGALPLFLVPYLLGGAGHYPQAFAGEMILFDFALALLVAASARRAEPESKAAPVLAVALYLASTAALHPVLYSRFDLAPAAITLGALHLAQAGRPRSGAFVLGVAASVKLWPVVLVPLFLLGARGESGTASRPSPPAQTLRAAAFSALAFAAGAALPVLPLVPRAGGSVLEFLGYHAARSIQIESLWSSVALVLRAAGLASVDIAHEYGAFHTFGRLPALLAAVSLPVAAVLALLPQAATLFGARERVNAVHPGATAAVLGFLVGAKVLSPQFMIWIAPLLSLQGGAAGAAWLVVCVLTTAVYPHLSPALEMRVPGHGLALACLVARNGLLCALYVGLTVRAWRTPAGSP